MSDNLKVLFVDDDVSYHDIAERMFRRYAITNVVCAINGCDAIEKIKTCLHNNVLPDCIVSDWEMPIIDGLSLLKRLRKYEKFKRIPLILISGAMTDYRRGLAKRSGAYACFQKPVNYNELSLSIREALSEKRAHRT
jgi:CheY-like chemotaxis protein